MRGRKFWPSCVIFLALAFGVAPAGFAQTGPSIVDTNWLAQKIEGKASPVIVFAGRKTSYDAAHIPGARLVALEDFIVERDPQGRAIEMQPVSVLTDTVRRLGITEQSSVVVYGEGPGVAATRFLLTLDMLGVHDVAYLNGGFGAWKAGNQPVNAEVPQVTPSTFTPHLQEVIVDEAWVKQNLKNPAVTLVDSRERKYYNGEEVWPDTSVRPGHIPGALNIPFSELMEPLGTFKDVETLRAYFEKAGVKKDTRVITYCHIGFQATVDYLAARLLGYKVSMYDGSFTEWGIKAELPVEKPAAPAEKNP